MEDKIQDWLEQYAERSRGQYLTCLKDFQLFLEEKDLKSLVKRLDKDFGKLKADEFARKWGRRVASFYQKLLQEGKSVNTARNKTIAVRSFFNSAYIKLKIRRGAIGKPQMAFEHTFTIEELRRMFLIGDIREKVILALGRSLGWGSGDFVKIRKEDITKAIQNTKNGFAFFPRYRKKSGEPMESIITPDAVKVLETYLPTIKGEWLFPAGNGKGHISVDTLNYVIRNLAEKAGIKDQIRFHLLRKFLISALVEGGLNEWEVKVLVGKAIPVTDFTYLQRISESAFAKFQSNVYPLIRLTESNLSLEEREKVLELTVKNILQYILQQAGVKTSRDLSLTELMEKLTSLMQ